jgi:polysaccharide deacetylase family protein (PEP-CTERM system associated)
MLNGPGGLVPSFTIHPSSFILLSAMTTPNNGVPAAAPGHNGVPQVEQPQIVLSFDVEEHDRIEAAAGLDIGPDLKAHYRQRLDYATRWLLGQLDCHGIKATFFVVGQIAEHNPGLIRAIHQAGHEVASHGWDHRRVHHFTPDSFREDVRRSKDALEKLTGEPILGYRAPTFSVVRHTAWAIDVLAELGLLYDSSIYPVRHDRYGVPGAPRSPFLARGGSRSILELPLATLRLVGANLPVGGGGYFRLLPLFFLERAFGQVRRDCHPPVAMLYFHPWEFDPEQTRLPLPHLRRWRTYTGIVRTRGRLTALLAKHRFDRAIDVARQLAGEGSRLPGFALTV